jgi:magnesium-transporting ATPase (P-type)
MAVKIKQDKGEKAIVKGAPETIFEMCKLKKSEKEKLIKIKEYLYKQDIQKQE